MAAVKAVLPVSTPEAKSGERIEKILEFNRALEQYHEWIIASVHRQIPHQPVFADGVDDVVQTILITFWLRLVAENVHISSPKAYIGAIVRSRCIDMIRQQQRRKNVQPLSLDQDDEPYQLDPLLTLSDETQDPALEYAYKELLTEVVAAVMKLPPCQQRAMICALKDEVKETDLLAGAFEKHGLDISAVNWPQDAAELQSMRSSLSAARRKLRSLLPYGYN